MHTPTAGPPPTIPAPTPQVAILTPTTLNSGMASTPQDHILDPVLTTLAPTTHLVPTTLDLTTPLAPTTLAPTTHLAPVPTTLAPTTHLDPVPTTLVPTTHQDPTTLAPTTHLAPTIPAPTTHLAHIILDLTTHLVPTTLAPTILAILQVHTILDLITLVCQEEDKMLLGWNGFCNRINWH